MKQIKLTVVLFIVILSSSFTMLAKELTGSVLSKEDSMPVSSAYVSLFIPDIPSTIHLTDKNGIFSFQIPDSISSDIAIGVTALGFLDKEEKIHTDSIDGPLMIWMEEESLFSNLSEITVTADQSNSIRRTANGEIFHLSAKAKTEHNPFIALTEIPLLISDYTTSSIKMLDGKQPLILIDGNQVNSGINPILPSDIESVEVITTVPARYLQEGYSGIVNIKLKRNRSPYVWFGASYSQSIPSYDSSGPYLNFEVGNEKLSLYGSGIYYYTRNDKTISNVTRSNTSYSQHYSSSATSSSDMLHGWLLIKYLATPRDYLAASIRYNDSRQESKSSASGEIKTDMTHDYQAAGISNNRNNTLSTNLYYKHSFAPFNNLELNVSLSTDDNRLNNQNSESIGNIFNDYLSDFKNSRTSGYLHADYSKTWSNGHSLWVGNHAKITNDRIHQTAPEIPLFKTSTISEYLYGAFGGRISKLMYNLSAGIEYISMQADNEDNNYFKPRISTSGTWMFDYHNSIALAYTLTNEAPSTALLSPRNTSTDPLIVSCGNPYLKPKTDHKLKASYTLNGKGWYVSPQVVLLHSRDMITPWGYSVDGVYYSTFRNSGRYSEMNYMLNLTYNNSWLSVTAANGLASHHFGHLAPKWTFQSYASLFARVKKFYIIAELHYLSRDYSEISITRHRNPLQSRLHISYNFSPDFYVAIGMKNFTGNTKTIMKLNQGSFRSLTETIDKGPGHGFTPYITVYYSFRKNNSRKISFDNPSFDEERGISLKRN